MGGRLAGRVQPNLMGWREVFACGLTVPAVLLGPLQAQEMPDRRALSPQTISLSSGPGSIEGLGESFESQLNTGSYVFRLPFKLPPVRGRAQPEVSMVYNSDNGKAGRLSQAAFLVRRWRKAARTLFRGRIFPRVHEADSGVSEIGGVARSPGYGPEENPLRHGRVRHFRGVPAASPASGRGRFLCG